MLDLTIYVEAIVALLVISAPFDPVKVLFFNCAISSPERRRNSAAIRVSAYVAIVLFGSALIGEWVLRLIGINLYAFQVVGGLVIGLMGFEMLYGGGTSKAQGGEQRESGPEEGDTLLIPLAVPLIAGPGAITTTITLTAEHHGLVPALIGAVAVVLMTYVSFAWLGQLIGRAKPATVAIFMRTGGLLLATIGAQMTLSGIKSFFA